MGQPDAEYDRREFERAEVQSFRLPAGGRLSVDQDVGAVEIVAVDGDRVRVTAVRRVSVGGAEGSRLLDHLALRASLDGDHLDIRVARRAGLWRLSPARPRMDLRIEAPRGVSVEVDSGSGPVTVEGIGGRVEIDVGAGAVTVRGLGEGCSIDTGGGRVVVESVRGSVHVDTGAGDVRIADVTGDVEVDTGSGPVDLRRIRAKRIEVDTGAGSMVCAFVPEEGGEYRFDTGTGPIELRLPPDASAAIDLSSHRGRVRCELPLTTREVERGRLSGVLGRAACEIDADSGIGDVVVVADRDGTTAVSEPLATTADPPPQTTAAADPPPQSPTAPAPASPQPRSARFTSAVSEEDYLRLLRLVEEKKVTPEQAEMLIQALEEESGDEDNWGDDGEE